MDHPTRLSIDAIVARYVDDQQEKAVLSIADLIADQGPQRRACLEALVRADAQLRIAVGETGLASRYRRQWPELAGSECLRQVEQLAADGRQAPNATASPSSLGNAAPSKRPAEFDTGDIVAEFEIIRMLGRGTHARVYLATDLTLGREVALKISDASGIEGQALAQLDHPNIVRVYGEKTVGRLKLLAMQFIEGRTMAQWLSDRPYDAPSKWDSAAISSWNSLGGELPTESGQALVASDYRSLVLQWMIRIASALNHAHQRGVLHRDLKPGNVMLDLRANPMLMDFNVARMVAREETGDFGGTLAYMSPEHLRAFESVSNESSDVVDVRSDIYSLGIVLLELLTGRTTWGVLPGDGPRLAPALLAQRLRGVSSETLQHVRSGSLRRVIAMCLAAEPEHRYQSAASLAEDLVAVHDRRPLIHANDDSVTGTLRSFVGRYSKSLAVGLAVIALFGGGCVILRENHRLKLEHTRKLLDQLESRLDSGDLAIAGTLLGETRVMTRQLDRWAWLGLTDSGSVSRRVKRFERELSTTQWMASADTVRLGLTSPLVENESRESVRRLLSTYGVDRWEDWEARAPFSGLSDEAKTTTAEAITEVLLITLLQQEDPVSDSKLSRFLDRLPTRHRQHPLFRELQRGPVRLNLHPAADNFEAHLRGVVAFRRESYALAIGWFEQSLSLQTIDQSPRFWTHFWNAMANAEVGNEAQAIASYGVCIGLRPRFAWPRYNLARLFAESDSMEAALQQVATA
ncbi:MAG: serine/threonine-protein kinase, partial [Planctomycetota bacterium]